MDQNGNAEVIKLGEDSQWIDFELHDKPFQVEVFDALDLLGEIDNQHIDDVNLCLHCKVEFPTPRESFGESGVLSCPACGQKEVRASQLYLDDVAKLLIDRFEVPKCSRGEARSFYDRILQLTDEAKKNIEPTPV